MYRKLLLFCGFVLVVPVFLVGQTLVLSEEGLDGLYVCGYDSLSVIVTNTSAQVGGSVEVTVDLPLGVSYEVGSVVGGSEVDVSDVSLPVFGVADVGGFLSDTFTIVVFADCDALGALNAGSLFQNGLSVTHSGGSSSVLGSPYSVETPRLVISGVSPSVSSALLGDQVVRTIVVENTRLGPLTEFVLWDAHTGSIFVDSVGVGTLMGNALDTARVLLSGNDFMGIGDGDSLFEEGESISIVEYIDVILCDTAVSDLVVSWGCGGEVCQQDVLSASVNVNQSALSPALVFTPSFQLDSCFCGTNAVRQSMLIENVGNADARDLLFVVSEGANIGGINGSSLLVNGNSAGVSYGIDVTNGGLLACLGPSGLKQEIGVSFPVLGAGDSLLIEWDMYYCSSGCGGRYGGWTYGYSYGRDCPAGSTVSGSDIGAGISEVVGSLSPSGMSLNSGNTQTYTYQVNGDILADASGGELALSLALPCRLRWDEDPNDFMLNGALADSLAYDSSSNTVYVTYGLPLGGSVGLLSFDVTLDCGLDCSLSPNLSGIVVDASVVAANQCVNICPITLCSSTTGVTLNCGLPPTSGVCVDSTGVEVLGYSIERANFGLPDNNGDGLPDASGSLNFSQIRVDRGALGDTLTEVFEGIVRIEDSLGGVGFPYAFVRSSWSKIANNQYNTLMTTGGVQALGAEVRIVDVSAGQVYDCSNVVLTEAGNGLSLERLYDIGAGSLVANGCLGLPSGFLFEEGDSIRLEASYVIMYEIATGDVFSTPQFGPIRLDALPFMYLSSSANPVTNVLSYGCEEERDTIEVVPNVMVATNTTLNADLCLPREVSFQFTRFFSGYFPFEYRLSELFSQMVYTPVPGWDLVADSTQIQFIQGFAGTPISQAIYVSPTDTVNGSYVYDLRPYYSINGGSITLPDASVGMRFDVEYGLPPCDTFLNFRSDLVGYVGDSAVLGVAGETVSLLAPDLVAQVQLNPVSGLGDEVSWGIDLINNRVSFLANQSGVAEEVWVILSSPSGNILNLTLVDTVSGLVVPQVNGIYQLGGLEADSTFHLRVEGEMRSCGIDEVVVRYGWNCSAYTDSLETSCSDERVILQVIPEPAELELTQFTNQLPSALCTALAYDTLRVFNSDLGSAYGVVVRVQVPAGVDFVGGSSELSYPLGSGFVGLVDPTPLGGGLYEWDLSALVDSIGVNGLTGVQTAPDHSLEIRYQLVTDCDLVAGSYLVYQVEGEDACGQSVNLLAQAGRPLDIVGLVEPYGTGVSVVMDSVIGCVDVSDVRVSVTHMGTTPSGGSDSIYVTLPVGVSYQVNSYVGLVNAPVGGPVVGVVNGRERLAFAYPSGMNLGDSLVFMLTMEGFDSVGCGGDFVWVQTVTEATAFCVATGTNCDISVQTGDMMVGIEVEKPSLSIGSFVGTVVPTGVQDSIVYSLVLDNGGSSIDSGTVTLIHYYDDNDGDLMVGNGDLLLGTDTVMGAIPSGGSLGVTGSFLHSANDYCHLLAVVDVGDQCLCEGDIRLMEVPVGYLEPDGAEFCSGDSELVGIVGVGGVDYQWSPSVGIVCDTCPLTSIALANSSAVDDTLVYTLRADDGTGCIVNHLFEVVVFAVPGIVLGDTSVCLGDGIQLIGSAGASHVWNGGGLNGVMTQDVVVSPDSTTVYGLSVTDFHGCVGSDSVEVAVLALPEVNGVDDGICENGFVQLNTSANGNYVYTWTPAGALSNASSSNPLAFPDSTTDFVVTVTDGNGCEDRDTVSLIVSPSDVVVDLGSDTNLVDVSVLDAGNVGCQYLWSTGETSQTIVPNAVGVYSVTVSCPSGCSNQDAILLTDVVLYGGVLQLEGHLVGDEVQLDWAVHGEDVSYFVLERFEHGGFIEVSEIVTSPDVWAYTYRDVDPMEGENRYRLVGYTDEGEVRYSNEVIVWYSPLEGVVSLYPNPTDGYLSVRYPLEYQGVVIDLLDLSGRVIQRIGPLASYREVTLDVRDLAKGVYLCRVSSDSSLAQYVKWIKE